ncbi:hypothetical protein CGI60_24240 [Vibrio parahaemolyticus]|nr:hypothetical protein CGI60_24240 [Vibrio parahaemolyticus]
MRCSPLNRALVANEKNVDLGLMSVCFWLGFRISIFSYSGLWKSFSDFLCGWIFCFRNRFTC